MSTKITKPQDLDPTRDEISVFIPSPSREGYVKVLSEGLSPERVQRDQATLDILLDQTPPHGPRP